MLKNSLLFDVSFTHFNNPLNSSWCFHVNLCVSTWIKCSSYMVNTLIVQEFVAVCIISWFLFTPARSEAGIVLSNNCYRTCSNFEIVVLCQKLKLKAPFLTLFLLPYILRQLDCCKGRWQRLLLTEELSCKETVISQAVTSEGWHT